MDLLGLKVIHRKFGPGIVIKENEGIITVEFLGQTSSFINPDDFYLHLKAEDESIQQILEREAIASIEQGRQVQIAWQKDRDEQIRAQVSKLYHPVNDLMNSCKLHSICVLILAVQPVVQCTFV